MLASVYINVYIKLHTPTNTIHKLESIVRDIQFTYIIYSNTFLTLSHFCIYDVKYKSEQQLFVHFYKRLVYVQRPAQRGNAGRHRLHHRVPPTVGHERVRRHQWRAQRCFMGIH
jgi:hypothetical protein